MSTKYLDKYSLRPVPIRHKRKRYSLRFLPGIRPDPLHRFQQRDKRLPADCKCQCSKKYPDAAQGAQSSPEPELHSDAAFCAAASVLMLHKNQKFHPRQCAPRHLSGQSDCIAHSPSSKSQDHQRHVRRCHLLQQVINVNDKRRISLSLWSLTGPFQSILLSPPGCRDSSGNHAAPDAK